MGNNTGDCQFQFRCLLLYSYRTESFYPKQYFLLKTTMTRWIALTLCFILMTTVIPIKAASSAISCIKSTKDCIRSSECCTGCCHISKCVEYNDSCLGDLEKLGAGHGALCNPKCSAGQTCQLQQVQCIRAPCPPIATCVSDDYRDYDN